MADAYTSTSLTDLVKTGYDTLAYFALRPEFYYSLTAGTRRSPVALTNRGLTLTFTGYNDLAAATTPLTETTTPDSVAPTTDTKTITINEYGNLAKSTAKLRGVAIIDSPAVDPALADLIGYNAALSYDTLARTALAGGTNIRWAGSGASSLVTVGTADTIAAADIRYVVAKLRGANGRGFGDMGVAGSMFAGFIHPDVAVDLRQETGDAGWLVPHNQSMAGNRWNGVVGSFEGVTFIETPRAPIAVDAGDGVGGAGTIDVYSTLIVGREALSLAWSSVEHGPEPQFVVGPIVDGLKRFHTFGWKWFGGFGRFRDLEELYAIKSASSIGTNA